MKNILLITPDDLFQQIEKIVTKNPERLIVDDWHQLYNGKEAFTSEQILEPRTKHDLAGWIVALTPRAPENERLRVDVDDYANEILADNLRKPISFGITFSDVESQLKVIKMRADEERVRAATVRKIVYN